MFHLFIQSKYKVGLDFWILGYRASYSNKIEPIKIPVGHASFSAIPKNLVY